MDRLKKAFTLKLSLLMLILTIFLVACSSNEGTTITTSATGEKDNSNEVTQENDNKYPEKPIEMILPYAAGGSTDQIARILQKSINENLPNGQTIQIINEPGGAGIIGLTKVLNAEPDGYTIGLTASGALTNQPHYGNTSYTHDSFQPIARVASSPILLAVKQESEWETLEDWITYISENPGKFTYTSSGSGNPAHIAMEKVAKVLNTQLVNVPAEGSGEAVIAMLGGHVNGTSGSSEQFAGSLDSEDIRILGNLGSIKGEAYEDVPTLQEQGLDAATDIFFGVLAPKGIPDDRLKILTEAFEKALSDENVIAQFKASGLEGNFAGPEKFQQVITENFTNEGEVLKAMGLVK